MNCRRPERPWEGRAVAKSPRLAAFMPIVAVSADDLAAGLADIRSDLRYLLDDRAVPEPIIARIGHLGITRMNVFAGIEARVWLEAHIGFRGGDGAQQRVQIALALDAWEAAKDRVTKTSELEA
ncbi:hypothetical protein N9L68_07855 [bacterium]|nr:hypothetical protein [bacterium]